MYLSFALLSLLIIGINNLLVLKKSRRKYVPDEYITKGLWNLPKIFLRALTPSGSQIKHFETNNKKVFQQSTTTVVMNLFNTTTVFAKDFDVMKSLLRNANCTHRFSTKWIEYLHEGKGKGILFNNGIAAKTLRRYTMNILARLGMGKHQIMSFILEEQLADLLKHFEHAKEFTGNRIQIEDIFDRFVVNVIWCIVGGEKFSSNDRTFETLHENARLIATFNQNSLLMLNYFPRRIIGLLGVFGFEYTKFFNSFSVLKKYFIDLIEKKELTINEENPETFVDHFLLEIRKHKHDEELSLIYNIDNLTVSLSDLFTAGMHTSSKYLECCIMFMILNPEVQSKVQQEIKSIIGDSVPCYTEHMKRMPFTQATLMEIHRLSNIVAAVPRMAHNDFKLHGKNFEKGTLIVNKLNCVRMDKCYWGDPDVFRPMRFLDAEGNIKQDKMNRVMPFGIGPRNCLGESLAVSSSFTFFTGIFQKYTVVQSNKNEVLGLSKGAVTSTPHPFQFTLIPNVN